MKLDYTLRLADDALIIGHRLSEWTGHGPVLEQDIALTNMALDHIGRARTLYQYAAAQYNELPADEKAGYFASVALQTLVAGGTAITEDDLAYLRDGWDFRNALLLEQPNTDWAYTVARSFYYDTYNYFFFTSLAKSTDETLAAIAAKSLKEATYHLRWSSEWVVRLGDGTAESHERMQDAVNQLWMYTGELFASNAVDTALAATGAVPLPEDLKPLWLQRVQQVMDEATIALPPANAWMQQGGRNGSHTEHLGFILAELQFMQRAYPGMEW